MSDEQDDPLDVPIGFMNAILYSIPLWILICSIVFAIIAVVSGIAQ